MASRLRIPQRVQLARHLSCPYNSTLSSLSFTLTIPSTRTASTRAARTAKLRSPTRQPPPSPPLLKPAPSPTSTSSSKPRAETLDVLVQQRKWPLFGAGILALGIGLYLSAVITSSLKQDSKASSPTTTHTTTPSCTCHTPLSTITGTTPPTGLPSALDTSSPARALQTARAFDASLDLPERLTGIASLRRRLAARARGHVLEVAVGTGRNLEGYGWEQVAWFGSLPEGNRDGERDKDAEGRREAREKWERERAVWLLEQKAAAASSGVGALFKGKGEDEGERGSGKGQQRGRQFVELGGLEGEVLSFTGVDVSGDMMGVARDRVREAVPGLARLMRKRRAEGMPRLEELGGAEKVGPEGVPVVDALDGRVRLVLGDAVLGLPAPPPVGTNGKTQKDTGPPPSKYDTIVQTFGLCSVADPARLLANMAAKVQPDTGRILLLEHGRGFWDWVNKRLDDHAPKHFQKYGCWWNRDIEQLVRDAAQTVPGLEVVSLERPGWFQFGTTLLIELRVKSQRAQGADGKMA